MDRNFNPQEVTVFAETNYRNQRRKFGIKVDDRRRHMYLLGKTGMGKSTMIENMAIHDIRAGHGIAVVDPHGDLVEKIVKFIPNDRINDVIYFNPADTNFPIAFNILESVDSEYKHLVAYGLVGVFKKIWADSWGPRMEYILINTILALLEYPGSTLLGIMRILVDKKYRKKVLSKVTDPVVKTFWTDEYANYSEKFRTEAIAPIQNKVGQFLASSIIRNIVGQSKSTINMREAIDSGKIILMNLSKGRIGEENSALLGAMMITKLQLAAMSRVNIPEAERRDFFLYVDEFQNFSTQSFANILSEARKYRLNIIMAHQYIEQLSDEVRASVFGNVGTLVCFRVGAADAAALEPEFMPRFLAQDIINVPKYHFILKLMIDGISSEPFSAIGLAPMTDTNDNETKVIAVSRERYSKPKNIVEEKILRWSGVDMEEENEVVSIPQKSQRIQPPTIEHLIEEREHFAPPSFSLLDKNNVFNDEVAKPAELQKNQQETYKKKKKKFKNNSVQFVPEQSRHESFAPIVDEISREKVEPISFNELKNKTISFIKKPEQKKQQQNQQKNTNQNIQPNFVQAIINQPVQHSISNNNVSKEDSKTKISLKDLFN